MREAEKRVPELQQQRKQTRKADKDLSSMNYEERRSASTFKTFIPLVGKGSSSIRYSGFGDLLCYFLHIIFLVLFTCVLFASSGSASETKRRSNVCSCGAELGRFWLGRRGSCAGGRTRNGYISLGSCTRRRSGHRVLNDFLLDDFSAFLNLLLDSSFFSGYIYRSILIISVSLVIDTKEQTYLAAPKGLGREAGTACAGLGDERGEGTADAALERGRSSSLRRAS